MKLKQLQHESDSWKRLLAFIMDENIHLKNRLTEVLKDKFNKNLLEDLEYFHNNFVREDEMIRLVRNDVVELDKLLTREIFEDGRIARQIERKLHKLRNNLENIQNQFWKLKMGFNNYLSENV
ncbi:MAG: hypothetical protein IPJ81_04830 [Chitinophagaceae bacterium]|nr:hypothetical protein [Chitinophagaceae bacterium]